MDRRPLSARLFPWPARPGYAGPSSSRNCGDRMTPALPLPGVASLARSPRRLLARLLPVALLALPLSATANPAANDLPVEEIQTFAEEIGRASCRERG